MVFGNARLVHPGRVIYRLRGDYGGRYPVPVRVHARDGKQNATGDRTVFRRRFGWVQQPRRSRRSKHMIGTELYRSAKKKKKKQRYSYNIIYFTFLIAKLELENSIIYLLNVFIYLLFIVQYRTPVIKA